MSRLDRITLALFSAVIAFLFAYGIVPPWLETRAGMAGDLGSLTLHEEWLAFKLSLSFPVMMLGGTIFCVSFAVWLTCRYVRGPEQRP